MFVIKACMCWLLSHVCGSACVCERTGDLIGTVTFAPNGVGTDSDRAEDEVPLGQVPSVERPVAAVKLNAKGKGERMLILVPKG
jgi:hypothetical protein